MRNSLKIIFIFLFLSLLIIRPTPSYAWHHYYHSYVGINLGVWPDDYDYDDWPYYGPPYYYPYYYPYYPQPYYPSYAVVSTASYQPVVVNGVTYYVNNGVYYLYTQYGYQAVAPPAGASATVTAAPVSVEAYDTFSVNIPNKKGGYTTVLLKKSGNGYIGPQGEYYSEFPKVSKLQVMYGK